MIKHFLIKFSAHHTNLIESKIKWNTLFFTQTFHTFPNIFHTIRPSTRIGIPRILFASIPATNQLVTIQAHTHTRVWNRQTIYTVISRDSAHLDPRLSGSSWPRATRASLIIQCSRLPLFPYFPLFFSSRRISFSRVSFSGPGAHSGDRDRCKFLAPSALSARPLTA